MSYSSGSVDTQSLADRRSHPRQSVLLSCVELEDNGGIVLNVSESGLAMQVVKTLPDSLHTKLRFQLSLSNSWIETRGRIAWLSASKNKAGVEFVDLDLEGRALLAKWISSAAAAELGADQAAAQPATQITFQAGDLIEEQIADQAGDQSVDQGAAQVADRISEQPAEHLEDRIIEGHIEDRIEDSPAALLPADPAEASTGAAASSEVSEPQPSVNDEPIDILSDYAVHALSAPETAGVNELFVEPDTAASTALASDDAPSRRGGFAIYSPEAAARWHIAEGGIAGDTLRPHSRIGLFVGLALVAVAITFVAISLRQPAAKRPGGAFALKKNGLNGAISSEPLGSGIATPTGESFAPSAGVTAEHASSAGSAPLTAAAAAVAGRRSPNAKKSSGPAPADSAAHSPTPPASQTAAPAGDSGFVLQVAAMSDQANALSFAGTLRRKNFPVFVVKPPADPLYRVLVGPYSDARSAATGAAELRKQGFSAIRKPNAPAP